MSLFGLQFSDDSPLHTETSKLMYNWFFLFAILHPVTLKGSLSISNEWSPEEAMYCLGHPKNIRVFFFKFLKILTVSDKTIQKAFIIHITVNKGHSFFFLHYLPNIHFGLTNQWMIKHFQLPKLLKQYKILYKYTKLWERIVGIIHLRRTGIFLFFRGAKPRTYTKIWRNRFGFATRGNNVSQCTDWMTCPSVRRSACSCSSYTT